MRRRLLETRRDRWPLELPLILVGGSGRAVVVTACKGDGHYSFYSLLAVNPE